MICVLDLGINVNFSEQKGNRRDSKCENSTTPCCWPWAVGSPEQRPVRSLTELTADFGWQSSRKQDLSSTNMKQGILPTMRKRSWTYPTSDLQNCEIINLYRFKLLKWKRQWHPTPVLLPGKSHGPHGKLQSMGSLRVGHDWATSLSLLTFMHWRRKWKPTPVFLPGESKGPGSLVGCCLWGHTESEMTEAT